MFKKLATIFAAAMLTLSASSAFAAFADLSLIRVVYERTTGTTEQVTDLGNINTILAGGPQTFAGSALSASTPANLFAAYFAVDRHSPNVSPDLWVSGSTTVAPAMVGQLGFNVTESGTTSLYSYYNLSFGGATGVVYTGTQANGNSYKSKLSASQGSLGNGINGTTRPFTEISLASLVGATSGSVTQNLYYIANADIAGALGVAAATITTNFDGSTTVTATPIPAAFYLMGSGLLGLVGLRRRNNA